MNQGMRALYQEPETDALPSLGSPGRVVPRFSGLSSSFKAIRARSPATFAGLHFFMGRDRASCHDPPRCLGKKRGFFLAAAAGGGRVHPCTHSETAVAVF